MEYNHSRLKDLKTLKKNKTLKEEWRNLISSQEKELKKWEKTLEQSYIYHYNRSDLPEEYREGWNDNIDVSMEISDQFEERDKFRKLSARWYVSHLINFWNHSPGVTVDEIIRVIREEKQRRCANKKCDTPYAKELIEMFTIMKKYLEKKHVAKAPGQMQKRVVQHTDSIVEWKQRIEILLESYTK